MEDINQYMPLSNDWNKERLETLKTMFPDLFTSEGKLNADEFKKLIDPQSINETERYEFRWFGKSQAKRNAFTPSNATLVYDEKRSVNPDKAENLIIEGENLEVLKLLSGAYREKIKCIYIDPPYNVDADAIYNDDYSKEKKPYWEEVGILEDGVIIDTNYEASGRFHSNWLNLMYSRLLLSRALLKSDGMIFIQIDDKELSNLKKLADEVFGEENFITTICVKMSHLSGMKMSHKDKKIPKIKEFILLYAKNKQEISLNPIYIQGKWEDVFDRYDFFVEKNDEPCKEWKISSLKEIIKQNKLEEEVEIENFRINNADKIFRTATNDSFKVFEKNNYFDSIITKTGLNKFIYKGEEVLFASVKITKIDGKNVPAENLGDIWLDIGINNLHNEGGVPFPNGKKPYKLIKRILEISTKEDDLVLDFFAGSGTTGEATIEINKDDNGRRNFILVQIPEKVSINEPAHSLGYEKIIDITIDRNKRAVERILEEKKTQQLDIFKSGESDKGLGFKVFKLTKSKFPRVEWTPEADKTDTENIEALKKYITEKEAQLVTMFNREELTTEILLKNGFNLNYTTDKQEQFKDNNVYLATDGNKQTLICLDNIMHENTVEHLKTNNTKQFICLERALDTTKKWNLKQYLGVKLHAF